LKKRDKEKDAASDNEEQQSGEKKKRPRYARAPPGSLANPDWD